jgi:hypothetical protein
MITATPATDEQLRYRLALRSSSAAQKHESKAKRRSNPGHGKRSQEKRRAISEQHRHPTHPPTTTPQRRSP